MVLPTIDIHCGDGWHRYTVTVEFNDMMAKKDILDRPSLRGLTGEKLVSAMLENSLGKIPGLQRHKRGKLQMGPNGEPSLVNLISEKAYLYRHYDGAFHDGPNGEAALQTICTKTGTLLEFTHYNYDIPCNGPNDTPHYIRCFPTGEPQEIKYVNVVGKLHDSPDGRPGHAYFDIHGNVVNAWKQRNGNVVRDLEVHEKRALAKSLRLEAAARRKCTLKEYGLLQPANKKKAG